MESGGGEQGDECDGSDPPGGVDPAVPPRRGHMGLIHEACGHETTQGEVCSDCGEPLVPEQMTWVKPWIDKRERLRPAGILSSALHGLNGTLD